MKGFKIKGLVYLLLPIPLSSAVRGHDLSWVAAKEPEVNYEESSLVATYP